MSADPTAEEAQEAASWRYVHCARVVGPLSSGRFAVMTLSRGQIIGMMEPLEVHPLLVEAASQSVIAYDLNKKEETERQRLWADKKAAVVMAANAPEDLGL